MGDAIAQAVLALRGPCSYVVSKEVALCAAVFPVAAWIPTVLITMDPYGFTSHWPCLPHLPLRLPLALSAALAAEAARIPMGSYGSSRTPPT